MYAFVPVLLALLNMYTLKSFVIVNSFTQEHVIGCGL